MKKEKFRVAVAGGAGFWGAFYLRAFSLNPDCEVVALVDTAVGRREKFAARYGIPSVFDNVDDLLKADIPDIVSTVLPVSSSYDAVLACAEAGVSVISCEKPISESLVKADEMVNLCREKKIPFVCGTALWEIMHLDRVHGWIREGHIGDIQSISIPSGISEYVSGNGCVTLNFLRFSTDTEAEWVEGRTWPAVAAETLDECGVSGVIGLSDGNTCAIPAPEEADPKVSGIIIKGEKGNVQVTGPKPVFTI
ncbi:MAG: Gfo/Idh/MocA family oxidoreductase, partial [Spirochaetales bacterium]|nr:Gfo/Idh/MocA family oxidoreductase [Spirochaetales bacterium]